MNICFISPYPPRLDGVGEFNQDLINSLKKQNKTFHHIGIAINQDDNIYSYKKNIVFQIRKNQIADYISAAKIINSSPSTIVCLQLEYSLFGGYDGFYIEKLIAGLKKQLFIVVHGLPINSYSRRVMTRKKFFQKIDPYVKGYIVINPIQKKVLESWGVRAAIKHIWHGAPDDIQNHGYLSSRKKLNITKELVILNFGLFHQKKGLEYLIEGFSDFVKTYSNTKLYLCGKMLSTEKNQNYFDEITKRIHDLRIKDNVIIQNTFFEKTLLYTYLRASDIIVLPYIKRDLVSSGPLSFAVLANKYIVLTPFPYAKELLSKKMAHFIHYKNSHDITNAFTYYLNNKTIVIKKKNLLRDVGNTIRWSNVARQYYDFFTN